MIQFACSGCGRRLRTTQEQAGKKTKCPDCGETLRIPAVPSETVTLPASPSPGGPVTEEFIATKGKTLPTSAHGVGAVTVPGYEMLEELGRGGMGVIYKARQLRPRRLVALKMILAGDHAGTDALARFKLEAEAAARLNHPSIVQVYEVSEHQGRPFLTLELVEGGTLARKLADELLGFRATARLIHRLAQAVQFAHDHGILHRDLKPANILLARNEEDETDKTGIPKIADFGLAKQIEGVGSVEGMGPRTQSGAILGTPAYMAPEQAGGKSSEVGPAVDVYALGAIFYECLTGHPPFQADSMIDLLMKVASEEPLAPRQVRRKCPRDLETLCLKCLEKNPEKRFASAGDLADELDRYLNDEPIHCRPTGRRERLGRLLRRNKNLVYLLAGAVAATCLSLVLLSVSGRLPKETGKGDGPDQEAVLPADLQLVPRDAFSFVTLRLADLTARKDVLDLEAALGLNQLLGLTVGGMSAEGILNAETGITPADVERITFFAQSPDTGEVALLALKRPVDLERLRKAFVTKEKRSPPLAGAKVEPVVLRAIEVQGKTVYQRRGGAGQIAQFGFWASAFCAYSDRVLLVGTTESLTTLLEAAAWAPDRGPLRQSLALAAKAHPLVVGFHPPAKFLAEAGQQRKTFQGLAKLEAGTLVLDMPAEEQGPILGFSANLRLDFPNDASAARGLRAASTLLEEGLDEIDKSRMIIPRLDKQWASLSKPLRNAAWQQRGKSVHLELEFRWTQSDVAELRTAQQEAAKRNQAALQQGIQRSRSLTNLMQIGQAMRAYHTKNHRFPPAAIYGKDDKPLYSWRVELLPFLGPDGQMLHKQFHLDEPWDSEHNKKLLDKMPAVYAAPWQEKKDTKGKTFYQVFVGPQAAFEGRKGLHLAVARKDLAYVTILLQNQPFAAAACTGYSLTTPVTDFPDGAGNTLLAVEAAEAVPWTAPLDLAYQPGKPLPKIGGHFPSGFNAVYVSGQATFLPANLPAASMRPLITRNGKDGPPALPRGWPGVPPAGRKP